MSMPWCETVSDLVDELYMAALVTDGWRLWTQKTGAWLGGIATGFTVWDRKSATIRCQHRQHPDVRVLERYGKDEIWRLDPQMSVLHAMDRLKVFTDLDHIDRDNPRHREYLSWTSANADIGHYLSLGSPVSPEIAAGFSIHRKRADGHTPLEARERLNAIAPHVLRALKLGFEHSSLLETTYWEGLLTERSEAVLLLDERGRVLRETASAAALLAGIDGLTIRVRHIVAIDPVSDATLQAAIGRATARRSAIGGAVRIKRPGNRPALVVSIFPLSRKARALAPVEAAALLTSVDPSRNPSSVTALWRQAFRLTTRETALAAELVAGHSLESAAAVLTMSRNTARAHLRALFAKTGCTRQVELTRLLTRIG